MQGHVEDRLLDYLYEELDDGQRREVETHLAACPRCESAYAELAGTRSLMAALPQATPERGTELLVQAAERELRLRETPRVGALARFGAWIARHPVSTSLAVAGVAVVVVVGVGRSRAWQADVRVARAPELAQAPVAAEAPGTAELSTGSRTEDKVQARSAVGAAPGRTRRGRLHRAQRSEARRQVHRAAKKAERAKTDLLARAPRKFETAPGPSPAPAGRPALKAKTRSLEVFGGATATGREAEKASLPADAARAPRHHRARHAAPVSPAPSPSDRAAEVPGPTSSALRASRPAAAAPIAPIAPSRAAAAAAPPPSLVRAVRLLDAGDAHLAVALLDALLAGPRAPWTPRAYYERCRARAALGRRADAEADCRQVVDAGGPYAARARHLLRRLAASP